MVTRLEAADESTREVVMPLVLELTEALKSAATLTTEGFAGDLTTEDLEVLQQEMQDTIIELCMQICEQLDIPIEEAAIAKLAARILKADFTASIETLPDEPFEDVMHERKTDDNLSFLADYRTPHLAHLPTAIGRTIMLAFWNSIQNTPVLTEVS
jgi:hypothetical protein